MVACDRPYQFYFCVFSLYTTIPLKKQYLSKIWHLGQSRSVLFSWQVIVHNQKIKHGVAARNEWKPVVKEKES